MQQSLSETLIKSRPQFRPSACITTRKTARMSPWSCQGFLVKPKYLPFSIENFEKSREVVRPIFHRIQEQTLIVNW